MKTDQTVQMHRLTFSHSLVHFVTEQNHIFSYISKTAEYCHCHFNDDQTHIVGELRKILLFIVKHSFGDC